MAPSFASALDARQTASQQRRDTVFLQVLAREAPQNAQPIASGSFSSSSTHLSTAPVIVLSIIAAVVAVAACVAVWFVFVQRRQLRSARTLRVEFNVDNLPAKARCASLDDGVVSFDEKFHDDDEKAEGGMYAVDLAAVSPAKPRIVVSQASPARVIPLPGHRRKFSREIARTRLRIFIPQGVAVEGVELVNTAAAFTPAPVPIAPVALVSSARSLAGAGGLSRRGTARSTARSSSVLSPFSSVSSAISAISEAAALHVAAYQSSGACAPAGVVYMPGPGAARDHHPMRRKTTTRKPARRVSVAAAPPRTAELHPARPESGLVLPIDVR